jgi:hypothetical protein
MVEWAGCAPSSAAAGRSAPSKGSATGRQCADHGLTEWSVEAPVSRATDPRCRARGPLSEAVLMQPGRQVGRQVVNVHVALAGPQDVGVGVHRPGTDGAAVSVRVGGALLYVNDRATVSRLARIWDMSGANVARLLPRGVDVTKGTVRGMAGPAVMVDADGSTPTFARLERPAGRPCFLRVTVGRILCDIRDLDAFRTTVAAFRWAESCAGTAFLPRRAVPAGASAAEAAGRAFAAPATAGRRSRPADRAAVRAAAAPSRSAGRSLAR